MTKFFLLAVLVLSTSLVATESTVAQEQSADIELNKQNYAVWRDHILPTESELEFLKIPWERTFKDGIVKANDDGKPVLLWVMNGHPLGCT